MFFVSREGNPAASTVYHFGGIAQNWTTATATHPQYYQVYVPFTGKVAAAYVHGFVGGTLGTAGTVGLEITNVTAATSVSLTGVALTAVFNDSVTTGLSFAVTAGDYIAIRVTTPAWATPAAGVAWQANLWLQ